MEAIPIVALSIPFFFLLIGIELLISLYQKKDYYRVCDALTSISCGIGAEVVGIFMKSILFFGYLYIYNNLRVYTMPDTFLTWAALFLGVDFFYYWFHRKSHEINALWAAHIVHHQSEDYNLSTALRQAWFQSSFSWVFYLPLAFAGFDPVLFLTISGINTVYQFWIHTKTVGKLGFLEWFMNTPSHHRVHHGKNPKYLDTNYAAVFIIWDRMFGTFRQEVEEPVYGITKSLHSWNPVWTNFHYWADLFNLAARTSRVTDKFKIFINRPGWQPTELGGFQSAPEVEKITYKKFDTKAKGDLVLYIFFQFVPILITASVFLFLSNTFSSLQKYSLAALIIFSVMNCGLLFEMRTWAAPLEFIRYIFILSALWLFNGSEKFIFLAVGTIVFVTVSGFWFFLKLKQFNSRAQRLAEVSFPVTSKRP